MLSKVLVLMLIVQTSQVLSNVISVSNGAQWGRWGEWAKCPNGSVAKGFSLKVDSQHVRGDDTAVNGIRLHCVKCKPPHDEKTITSEVAPWGDWKETKWCNYGILAKFSMRVEPNQEDGDDTAVNNFKFQCTDKGQLEGRGLYWGEYGAWSETCANGICGLKTKVQGNDKVPSKDNTGLNDVQFLCCN
ncbi:vitelline membrane outer layer protein 1 homolog [Dendrobates tinctorius]|uniref:vitelline membrane outer layer protein 1 homolog n=1 Tax=Dendrobates tinctorius TaxID=92724 RepID=UPI003CC95A4B